MKTNTSVLFYNLTYQILHQSDKSKIQKCKIQKKSNTYCN